MGQITDLFAEVFRDYATSGIPASGGNDPSKPAIRSTGVAIDNAITQLASAFVADAATVIYAAQSSLFANVAPGDRSIGIVYNDAVSKNGVYIKNGASGTGSWNSTGLMLAGPKGDDGVDGAKGDKGEDGEGFYQVALRYGLVPPNTGPQQFVSALAGQIVTQATNAAIIARDAARDSAASAASSAALTGALKAALDQALAGTDKLGVVIPEANARFQTIGTAMLANVPAYVKYVDTLGFYSAGDGGRASYRRVAANPAIGAGSFRTTDRFMPDGSTSTDNGGWWQYSIEGPARIEQFGGQCDCPFANFGYDGYTATYPMPTAGSYTDNLQPLYDAIRAVNVDPIVAARNEVGSMIPIEFMRNVDTTKCYGFSGKIIPQYASYIRGSFSGGDSIKTGTTFRFPPNTGGILFNHALKQPAGYAQKGAGFSILQGIWFQGGGGTDRTAHGMRQRVPIRLWQCTFDSFSGNNLHNVASVGVGPGSDDYGLTSGTHYVDVTCRASGNWNTFVDGGDVSASLFDNLQHKNSRLGGLYDSGYFANTYVNYGNHGHGGGFLGSCRRNGRRFALISPVAGIGGSTEPGTNDLVWEDRSADDGSTSAYWKDWVSGGDYQLSVPSYIGYAGTRVDGYVENYYLPQVGGTLTGTPLPSRYSNAELSDPGAGLEIVKTRNFGYRYSVPSSSPAFPIVGGQVESKVGGGVGDPTIISGWSSGLAPSGWTVQYTAGGRIRVGIGFAGSGNPMAYEFLDGNTTVTLGRSAPQPGYIVFSRFAFGNPNGAGVARAHESFDGPPVGTDRANGETLWSNNTITKGSAPRFIAMGDGTVQPDGIVGAVPATGLNSSSTTAQIVAALQAAGLAA